MITGIVVIEMTIKKIYQKIKKKYIKPKIECISIYHQENVYFSYGKIPGYMITASEYDECGRRRGDK